MGLKTLLDEDQFGELDESTRGLYAQGDDGKYVLDVEGIDDHPTVRKLSKKSRLAEEHRRNAERDRDGLKTRFGPLVDAEDLDLSTVDPERVTELMPYLTGEAQLPKPGEGGGEMTAEERERVRANARKPVEIKLEATEQDRDQWKSIAQNTLINGDLASEFQRAGVKDPDFVDLLVERYAGKGRVEVEDGKVSTIIDSEYGETSIKEFVKEWSSTDYAKKFIEAERNGGGGARGGSGSGKVKNPWSKEHWNMSEQGRIIKEDPDRAKRMAEEHGKRVG